VGGLCDSTDFLSYQIESGGKLKYLGDSGQTFLWDTPLTFSSSNKLLSDRNASITKADFSTRFRATDAAAAVT